MKSKATLIFIHGACHGPWSWEKFIPYFKGRGYYTEAVSLYGDQSNLKTATLGSYLDVIERAVDTAKKQHRGPVILVGHSLGGGVAQCFAAQRAGKVDGIILMSAPPLRRFIQIGFSGLLRTLFSPRAMAEGYRFVRIMAALARRKPLSADLIRRSSLFSSRITPAEAQRYTPLLVPEPLGPDLEFAKLALRPKRGNVPVHAIASTGDRVRGPRQQKMLADSYGGQTVVLDGLCHDMMLDPEWERAAEAVEQLVQQIDVQLSHE